MHVFISYSNSPIFLHLQLNTNVAGKTATLVALIELAVRLGQSVLITSHTHSAVDNVLLRLRGRVDFLRLGATHKLHPLLVEYGEKLDACKTPQELQAYYNAKVFFFTINFTFH